jgi:hypothetical protein
MFICGSGVPYTQAWSLLLVGPFLDKLVSADWVFKYHFHRGEPPFPF